MQYTCPISTKKVDQNIVRITGFFTFIILLTSLFFIIFWNNYSYYIFAFLIYEFSTRIWVPNFSILRFFSILLAHKILKIKPKPIDAAPKRFAAVLGLLFSIIIFIIAFTFEPQWSVTGDTLPLNYNLIIIKIIISFFTFAVFLETFFAFCIGCKIYSYIQFAKNKIK